MAHQVTVFANFELKDIKDPESFYYNAPDQQISVLNQLTESETITINDFNKSYDLSISTNGIDGIGYDDNTFEFDKIYYETQKIYFTVRVKTDNKFPAKNRPKLFIDPTHAKDGSLTVELVDSNQKSASATFFTNFDALSTETLGGFYNGYFIPHTTGDNFSIKAICNTSDSVRTKFSNTFSIYNSAGIYDFRKINEDNNEAQNYKNILFQPNLINNPNFFDQFLGKIVGNNESEPNTLGIKIYEKISNFVANNADIETCNVNQMISQLKLIDNEVLVFADDYPSSMSRIVDFFSLQLSKIKETLNNYNYNFDNKGYTDNNKYGINLGSEINLTDVLSGGVNYQPIVAYDKFAEEYIFLNSDPTSAFDFRFLKGTVGLNFCLSSYNSKWPWPLILPGNIGNLTSFVNESASDNFTLTDFILTEDNNRLVKEGEITDFNEISKYYTFYNYTSTINGSKLDYILDSSNSFTNISLSSLSAFNAKGGPLSDIILNNLYTKTSLLS